MKTFKNLYDTKGSFWCFLVIHVMLAHWWKKLSTPWWKHPKTSMARKRVFNVFFFWLFIHVMLARQWKSCQAFDEDIEKPLWQEGELLMFSVVHVLLAHRWKNCRPPLWRHPKPLWQERLLVIIINQIKIQIINRLQRLNPFDKEVIETTESMVVWETSLTKSIFLEIKWAKCACHKKISSSRKNL
jgi:hypothetical protein